MGCSSWEYHWISLIDDGWCLPWIGIYTSPKFFHSWCSKSPPYAMVLTHMLLENELIFLKTRPLRAGAPGESPWNRPQGCDSHESAYALQSGGSERGRWLHWYLFLAHSIEPTQGSWPYPYLGVCKYTGESESNWRSLEPTDKTMMTMLLGWKSGDLTIRCHRKWWFLLSFGSISRGSPKLDIFPPCVVYWPFIRELCMSLSLRPPSGPFDFRSTHDRTILGCCNPCHFRRIHRNSPAVVHPQVTRIHQNSPQFIRFTTIHHSFCGWWFGTCSIFPHIGNNHPNWLIFFRGVQTTNQFCGSWSSLVVQNGSSPPRRAAKKSRGAEPRADRRSAWLAASGALVFGGRIATMWGHPS